MAATDISAFFVRFENASTAGNWQAFDELFLENFLNLDPTSSTVVARSDLVAALPLRDKLFASIGARGATLTETVEAPLDDQHVLVKTSWSVIFTADDVEPMTLSSTFLLTKDHEGWRIAVYLNHQDLPRMIAKRLDSALPAPG